MWAASVIVASTVVVLASILAVIHESPIANSTCYKHYQKSDQTKHQMYLSVAVIVLLIAILLIHYIMVCLKTLICERKRPALALVIVAIAIAALSLAAFSHYCTYQTSFASSRAVPISAFVTFIASIAYISVPDDE